MIAFHDDMDDPKDDLPPPTRDIALMVEHCKQVEAELRHQYRRLAHTVAKTQGEGEHLPALREQYREAAIVVRVLRRYHQGRLERSRAGVSTRTVPSDSGIDARGVARANVNDED